MYADDTVLFFSAPEVCTIEATLVRELEAIECWLRLNSLFINVTKTEVMLFGKRFTEFKYLGVIFDEHLSWNQHVKEIASKAGRLVGLLGRVRHYITTHSANAIFFIYD